MRSSGAGEVAGHAPEPGLLARMFEPSVHVTEPGERIRARLLAAMVLALAPVGLASGATQAAVTPGFDGPFAILLAASGVLALVYGLARSRWYRMAGLLAALLPIVVGAGIGLSKPDDPVWFAFMTLGVLLATMFTTLRLSVLVSLLGAAAMVGVGLARETFGHAPLFVPAFMFYAGFSAVLLVVSVYRERIDVARRRALMDSQAVLAHAQRMETVGHLAGGLAHDFNNLLAGIYGLLDAVEHGNAQPEDVADLRDAAERAAHLTRQLLAYGRPQAPEFDVVDVARMVGKMEGILRRVCGRDVQLLVRIPSQDRPATVRADAALVEQAIVNLVANARDAVEPGGHVVVEVSQPSGADAVHVAVSDDGVGIPEDERRRIFEPFVSSKGRHRGTGLGLAVVQRVMDECGGRVEVESTEGVGSTFRLILPRVDDVASSSGVLVDSEDGEVPGREEPPVRRALVVDDEPGVRRTMARALRGQGWEVAEAARGDEALSVVRAAPEPFHLLVTDVSMPGMGGGELADAVKELSPRTRVLFVSGRSEDDLLASGVAAGELNFLAKPFTAAQLGRAARKLVP